MMRGDFGGKRGRNVKNLTRRGKMGREMREKLRKFDGSGEPIFRFNLNAINKEGMMRTCMTCRENRQNNLQRKLRAQNENKSAAPMCR